MTRPLVAKLVPAAILIGGAAASAAPVARFQSAASSAPEGTSLANIVVELSEPSANTVTVNHAVTGGTASTGRGGDYAVLSGPLTFNPGQTSLPISISITGDSNEEPDETIQLTLTGAVNASLRSPTQHTYTILDDDGPLELVFVSAGSSGREADLSAAIPVRLTSPAGQTVTVNYAVSGGSAAGNGVDYTLPPGTLTFAPGTLIENIPISIVDDGLPEPTETVEITLSNPQNATLGAIAVHTFAILESEVALTTVRIADGLEKPLLVTAPPGDCERIFIVGQEGTIQIMRQEDIPGTPTRTFLDISDRVSNTNLISHGRSEQGLLGLAFHPDYANNGYFYVHYTKRAPDGAITPGDSVIARFSVTADPDVADPNSEHKITVISNTTENHNAGMVAFSPVDGYLYATIGIHSGSGPEAQDPLNTRGKLLRLDVEGDDFPADPERNYAVPPDNPFVGDPGTLDEIWALGLRNPWRFSFDRANGDFYVGDVGRGTREEVSYAPGTSSGGENYGFNIFEGDACVGNPCDPTGMTMPLISHTRTPGYKESIIGGYVYRGTRIPGLDGTYFYGDWFVLAPTGSCAPSGPSRIWSIRVIDGTIVDPERERTTELDPGGGMLINNLTAFGQDAEGSVYICSRGDINTANCPRPRFLGEVYKIVAVDDPEPYRICRTAEPAPVPALTWPGVGILTLALLAGTVLVARRRPTMA